MTSDKFGNQYGSHMERARMGGGADEDHDALTGDRKLTPERAKRMVEQYQALPKKRKYPSAPPEVRHTVCRHCGQDIEGFLPYPAGEWRDRGSDTHCGPNYETQAHEPVTE